MSLSKQEISIMEQALGWQETLDPPYRNYFCASSHHKDWETLNDLCRRDLMYLRSPAENNIGTSVFAVTMKGFEELRKAKEAHK